MLLLTFFSFSKNSAFLKIFSNVIWWIRSLGGLLSKIGEGPVYEQFLLLHLTLSATFLYIPQLRMRFCFENKFSNIIILLNTFSNFRLSDIEVIFKYFTADSSVQVICHTDGNQFAANYIIESVIYKFDSTVVTRKRLNISAKGFLSMLYYSKSMIQEGGIHLDYRLEVGKTCSRNFKSPTFVEAKHEMSHTSKRKTYGNFNIVHNLLLRTDSFLFVPGTI